MEKIKWHGVVFALFILFLYIMGVYDIFMMLSFDEAYYASKGYGQSVVEYFTNYPLFGLVFWIGNLAFGLISPTLRVPLVILGELKRRIARVEQNKLKMGNKYRDHDYVCCQKNGEACSTSAFNQALKKACTRAGVRQISVHSLRHIYATILLEAGVSLAKVSALLGHSSVHTTFEYYCEVIDERDTIKTYLNDTFTVEYEVDDDDE